MLFFSSFPLGINILYELICLVISLLRNVFSQCLFSTAAFNYHTVGDMGKLDIHWTAGAVMKGWLGYETEQSATRRDNTFNVYDMAYIHILAKSSTHSCCPAVSYQLANLSILTTSTSTTATSPPWTLWKCLSKHLLQNTKRNNGCVPSSWPAQATKTTIDSKYLVPVNTLFTIAPLNS